MEVEMRRCCSLHDAEQARDCGRRLGNTRSAARPSDTKPRQGIAGSSLTGRVSYGAPCLKTGTGITDEDLDRATGLVK
jgi:hypothetical protein